MGPGEEPRAERLFLHLHSLLLPSVPQCQIRIDKLVDKWSGSIEIGVTTHNPNSLEYPATMTNLQSGTSPGQGRGCRPGVAEGKEAPYLNPSVHHHPGTIMMSGCGILTNGKGTRREYCEFSLDELQVRVAHRSLDHFPAEPQVLCDPARAPSRVSCVT